MSEFEVIKVTTFELIELLKKRNLIDSSQHSYLMAQYDLHHYNMPRYATIIAYLRERSFDVRVEAKTWSSVDDKTIMTVKFPVTKVNYNSIW